VTFTDERWHKQIKYKDVFNRGSQSTGLGTERIMITFSQFLNDKHLVILFKEKLLLEN